MNKKYKKILISGVFILCLFLIISKDKIKAQENDVNYLKGKVVEIIEEKETYTEELSMTNIYQVLKINLRKEDKDIKLEVGGEFQSNQARYKVGDKVIIQQIDTTENPEAQEYSIFDYDRRGSLFALFILFALTTILVGKLNGIRSFAGLAISFVAVLAIIIPAILKGYNPIFISILTGIILIPTTFYLSHGFSTKSTIAVIGTLISLLITGILASIAVNKTHLNGQGIEEALFLQTQSEQSINIANLITGGIIISLIGVLDDVTISQVSIVKQLKESNKNISNSKLYKKSMKVGKDHISSMVNTLVLTYTGASIPLLLIFSLSNTTFNQAVNLEIVAVEIVRSLVASIGLLLAIPITTFLACNSENL